jgi:hypothetical protein
MGAVRVLEEVLMDGPSFDRVARDFAHPGSRRSALRVLAGAAGGGLLALAGLGGAGRASLTGVGVATAAKSCRGAGHPCEGNQTCCDDLVCVVSGPGKAKRCTCPSGTVFLDGTCCTPDNAAACAGKCGPQTNNCEQPITCDCGCLPVGTCCADEATCRETCCSQTPFGEPPACESDFACGRSGPGGACASNNDCNPNSGCVNGRCCGPTGFTIGGSVPTCAQCCSGECNSTRFACA